MVTMLSWCIAVAVDPEGLTPASVGTLEGGRPDG
jgi:hypothetical protein